MTVHETIKPPDKTTVKPANKAEKTTSSHNSTPGTCAATAPQKPAQKPAPENRPDNGPTIPVISAIAIRITPEITGYQVAVLEKDRIVYTKLTRSAPWLSDQIQREIVNGSHPKLNPDSRPDKNRYKDAMLSCFAELERTLEQDPEQKRSLSSVIVAGIIQRIREVHIYPGEATFLEVAIDEKTLCFTSKEIAHQYATTLNEKYFNGFYVPLDATSKEWTEIRNYWSEIGIIEENAAETEMDVLIEHLADHLASQVFIYSDRNRIDRPDVGYYESETGIVWIPTTVISLFLDRFKASYKRAELVKELVIRKITRGNAQPKKFKNLPSGQKRYWQFEKNFIVFCIDETGTVPEITDMLLRGEAL